MIDFLIQRFREFGDEPALIFENNSFSYRWLVESFERYAKLLNANDVAVGSVAAVFGDFSPETVALSLALIAKECIWVPLTNHDPVLKKEFCEIAEVETIFQIENESGHVKVTKTGLRANHKHLLELRQRRHPGLILFSSGSTGKSKAALHNLSFLLEKFKTIRPKHTMISFLLFDHIGGVNTLLSSLSTGGTLVTTENRKPDTVAKLIEKFKIETLPTTPTFLNLLLISETEKRFDLSSLTTITYGTEVMPESTLQKLKQAFPNARLHQTYGLSELGIMRSKSESSGSLWMKIGGEGFQTRVRDGLLEIKAHSAMLGYLNAPSPFTEDGWFKTHDAVEVKGEYLKILGRRSELINVGGEKVYPAEVESVLQMMDEVAGAVVIGERNALMGYIVKAKVRLKKPLEISEFRKRMRQFCKDKLSPFKIPQKVELIESEEWNERFKKIRKDELLS